MLLVYVEAGLGSKVLAQNLQRMLSNKGCHSELTTLADLVPARVLHILFGNYRIWCSQGSKNLSYFYKSRFLYPILYRIVLPLLMQFYRHHDAHRIRDLLQRHKQVIATSFLAAYFVSFYNKKYDLKLDISGVCGDYGISYGWRIELQRLFVSHCYQHPVLQYLDRQGTELCYFGIPAYADRQEDGIRDAGTIMIAGGGWGLGAAFDAIPTILKNPRVTKIFIMCGDNAEKMRCLRKDLQQEIATGRVSLHGMIDNLTPYYRRANMLITKAGGLSLTEAVLHGVIPVITSTLFSHELKNAHVFLNAGAAFASDDKENTLRIINTLINDTELADRTRVNGQSLVNPLAIEQIAKRLNSSI